MRLRCVENEHSLTARIKLRLMRLVGQRPPDVITLLLHRPEFFGTPYARLVHSVMRGRSEWTVAERELFAAYVSRQNQCRF